MYCILENISIYLPIQPNVFHWLDCKLCSLVGVWKSYTWQSVCHKYLGLICNISYLIHHMQYIICNISFPPSEASSTGIRHVEKYVFSVTTRLAFNAELPPAIERICHHKIVMPSLLEIVGHYLLDKMFWLRQGKRWSTCLWWCMLMTFFMLLFPLIGFPIMGSLIHV